VSKPIIHGYIIRLRPPFRFLRQCLSSKTPLNLRLAIRRKSKLFTTTQKSAEQVRSSKPRKRGSWSSIHRSRRSNQSPQSPDRNSRPGLVDRSRTACRDRLSRRHGRRRTAGGFVQGAARAESTHYRQSHCANFSANAPTTISVAATLAIARSGWLSMSLNHQRVSRVGQTAFARGDHPTKLHHTGQCSSSPRPPMAEGRSRRPRRRPQCQSDRTAPPRRFSRRRGEFGAAFRRMLAEDGRPRH
jgi:hypothetical protein